VNIERPDRRKAQFSAELIAPLRFDKQLRDAMEHTYSVHGDSVYQAGYLKANDSAIYSWCEDNDINLNAKAKTKLLDTKMWLKQHNVYQVAEELLEEFGDKEYDDFNEFKDDVDATIKNFNSKKSADLKKSLKEEATKVTPAEKKTVLDAVSWYDESAVKVIKKVVKFKQEKLDELLHHLDCEQTNLGDFGYFATGNKNEFTVYEPNSDLRDAESVPLNYMYTSKNDQAKDTDNSEIHQYFLDEVKKHVTEAWINLDSTKIGYEISFNKYFYQHKPLRVMEDVATDIITLEQKAEGLISDILGVDISKVYGV
jgi:type I restriction enzyme M protein